MQSNSSNGKLTIGFLTQFSTSFEGFQDQLWLSMVEAAKKRDVNLLLFSGGSIDTAPYNLFEKNLNTVYDLINSQYIDGLIINNVITAYISEERFNEFASSYSLPSVMVLGEKKGYPSVKTVNDKGMRAIILHLIKDHDYQNIAFIKGTAGYPDSEDRFAVYRDTLTECNRKYDPDLVFQGQFDEASGEKAADYFMKLGRKIDAIVASNDAMAFGAISVLRKMGKQIPWDIAVTGFDDIIEAGASSPSLTTVRQPFKEIFISALDILINKINLKGNPSSVLLPAEMIVRQSCGCNSKIIAKGENFKYKAMDQNENNLNTDLSPLVESILKEMTQENLIIDNETLSKFIKSFINDIEKKQKGSLIKDLQIFFQKNILSGQDILPWQNFLYVLRKWIPCICRNNESVFSAETLIVQASALVGESSAQSLAYQKVQVDKTSRQLRDAGQEFITTFNFDQLKLVIQKQLSSLKIPSCFISLFSDLKKPESGSKVFFSITNEKGIENKHLPMDYKFYKLPSGSFYPSGKRFAFAVHPLFFKESRIGFAMFELGPESGIFYDTLQVQISSSLMGSFLLRQMEENENAEKKRNDLIQELVRPMLDSINYVTQMIREKIGAIDNLIAVTKENRGKLDTTNTAIKSMNEKIGKILDITNIINDISARVNIIAINASIESTHAGQYGKSFSVIALEIHKLADTIKVNAAVISNSLKDIRSITDISKKAGNESFEAFIKLEEDVLDLAVTLKKINCSMEELSNNSSKILTTMNLK